MAGNHYVGAVMSVMTVLLWVWSLDWCLCRMCRKVDGKSTVVESYSVMESGVCVLCVSMECYLLHGQEVQLLCVYIQVLYLRGFSMSRVLICSCVVFGAIDNLFMVYANLISMWLRFAPASAF